MADDYDAHDDPGWFRDELRQRDRAIAELRSELDEANDILRRFDEYVEDYNGTLERWRETFGMELTDDGKWTWQPFWNKYADLVERYGDRPMAPHPERSQPPPIHQGRSKVQSDLCSDADKQHHALHSRTSALDRSDQLPQGQRVRVRERPD